MYRVGHTERNNSLHHKYAKTNRILNINKTNQEKKKKQAATCLSHNQTSDIGTIYKTIKWVETQCRISAIKPLITKEHQKKEKIKNPPRY